MTLLETALRRIMHHTRKEICTGECEGCPLCFSYADERIDTGLESKEYCALGIMEQYMGEEQHT